MKIKLKRVYDAVSKDDGTRIFVERLWPRGLKKNELIMDAWLKEIAPSPNLRKWYSHDVTKWEEFQRRYDAELDANIQLLEPLLKDVRKGTVTLLYASKDEEHNSAVCLKRYLERPKRMAGIQGK